MPSADEDELQNLTDDIRARGLLDPIVLFEKRILDGRNRAAACESAGVAPRYVEFEGTREEALMFVVSHNLKRRHLTKQAIADTLVEAEDFNLHYELGEAATPTDVKICQLRSPKRQRRAVNWPRRQAARVSRELINATRKVKEKGLPELQEAVKKGRIGVQDAAKAADLSPGATTATYRTSPKPRRAAQVAIEAAKRMPPRRPPAVRATPALRFARLGKRPPPCAAYGKPPTTVRGNGLWTWFGPRRPITESGALLNPWTNPRTRNKGDRMALTALMAVAPNALTPINEGPTSSPAQRL